jgi:hypothetical protein
MVVTPGDCEVRQDLKRTASFSLSVRVEMTWRPCLVTLYLGLGRRGADLCQRGRLSVRFAAPMHSSADSVLWPPEENLVGKEKSLQDGRRDSQVTGLLQ